MKYFFKFIFFVCVCFSLFHVTEFVQIFCHLKNISLQLCQHFLNNSFSCTLSVILLLFCVCIFISADKMCTSLLRCFCRKSVRDMDRHKPSSRRPWTNWRPLSFKLPPSKDRWMKTRHFLMQR